MYMFLSFLLLNWTEEETNINYEEHSSATVLKDFLGMSYTLENSKATKRARRVRRDVKERPRVIRILVFADKALIKRYNKTIILLLFCNFLCARVLVFSKYFEIVVKTSARLIG